MSMSMRQGIHDPQAGQESGQAYIEAYHLSKRFQQFTAVHPLSFKVSKGDIVGFLGPNGAGKSTTLRMLSGALSPTSGSVLIGGFSVQTAPIQAKQQLGYLPENAPLYQDMTPVDFLHFIAACRGLRRIEGKRRTENVIGKLRLERVAKQPIVTLSKGYKRRVALAQALLHNPQVLILDEPTDGLDPEQKREVYAILREMSRFKAIILSTHMLDDVEHLCQRCLIIHDGHLVADTTPMSLRRKSHEYQSITVSIPNVEQDEVEQAVRQLKSVTHCEWLGHEENCFRARLYGDNPLQLLVHVGCLARQRQWTFDELNLSRGNLGSVYQEITS